MSRTLSRARPRRQLVSVTSSAAANHPELPPDHPVFARRYIILTTEYEFLSLPNSPLAIPSGWSRRLADDFRLADYDFCGRSMALGRCATENRATLKDFEKADRANKPLVGQWSLVFEIGDVEEDSFVSLEGGCSADLNLRTTLTLVRPTTEESEAAHV